MGKLIKNLRGKRERDYPLFWEGSIEQQAKSGEGKQHKDGRGGVLLLVPEA